MGSRLLVLVTLALTWTSNTLSGTSLIVPREPGQDKVSGGRITKPTKTSNTRTNLKAPQIHQLYETSDVSPQEIENRRRLYRNSPSAPLYVSFRTNNDRSTKHNVQTWHGVPNFVAFEIAQDPHIEFLAAVPVVVTAYSPNKYTWDSQRRRWYELEYADQPPIQPTGKEPTEHESLRAKTVTPVEREEVQLKMQPKEPIQDESALAEVAACTEKKVEYSTLYVATWEPGGSWLKGTALWTHLLYHLQNKYRIAGTPTTTTYNYLILQIAVANPDLSMMLFFDGSPKPAAAACNFWLLPKVQIELIGDKASTWKRVIGYVPSQEEKELGIFDMRTYLVRRGCL